MSRCRAFEMSDAVKAWKHMDFEVVKDYGDQRFGHAMHTWDEGGRMLCRCRTCGGYILIQNSEYHGMEEDHDYTDYFPVEDEREAEDLNRRYDGFRIEREFRGRYLMMNDLCVSWCERNGRQ